MAGRSTRGKLDRRGGKGQREEERQMDDPPKTVRRRLPVVRTEERAALQAGLGERGTGLDRTGPARPLLGDRTGDPRLRDGGEGAGMAEGQVGPKSRARVEELRDGPRTDGGFLAPP